jgi:protein phosphatase
MSLYPQPDPFPPPRLHVTVACRSDVGRSRPENEDRVMVGDAAAGRAWAGPCEVAVDVVPCGFYALVCDGMGGEVGGEIASTLATEVIAGAMTSCFLRFLAEPARTVAAAEERLERAMKASIDVAAARLKTFSRQHPRYRRMGTTATLAAIGFGSMFVAQVGDSRAYLLRDGRLAQLTRDQTWAELVRSQSPAAAGIDPHAVGSNVILQAVGASATLDVVLTRHELRAGDRVLLCSDGLSGPVADADIQAILENASDPTLACDALVQAANANGGPDNVSCVLFHVDARG